MNPFSQNNSTYNTLYTPGGYEKEKLKLAVGILVGISVILLIVFFSIFQSEQARYTRSATAAARKYTPNAKVTDIKVAGGFALAIVSDPGTKSQASAGNTTVFKVNKDGSMTQIANGSSFSPLDLLGLGIPLATQAKLTGSDINQIKQSLLSLCGDSSCNTPIYNGFSSSFSPNGWQIDSATLDGLQQALTAVVSNKNTEAEPGKKIICVNATQNKSNATTDAKTYISTFTLEVQFVAIDGTLTTHVLTFAIGPHYYHDYKLDGQKI